jgi:subtilisin family serine protease
VSVTASDAADTVADFSTTGTSVSVAAPGVDVTSTHPFSPTGYASWSGSSMASPFAAGTAALIRSVRPSTPGEVLALIAGSARPVSSTFGTVGFGRLDPLAAVSDARANNIPTAAQAGIPEKCLP